MSIRLAEHTDCPSLHSFALQWAGWRPVPPPPITVIEGRARLMTATAQMGLSSKKQLSMSQPLVKWAVLGKVPVERAVWLVLTRSVSEGEGKVN